jgi:hypothetical protein
MKLKHRIKRYDFPFAKSVWIAQYKILGIWFSIDNRDIGHIFRSTTCYCESFKKAKKRIKKFERDLERAKEWYDKWSFIEWESKF